MNMISSFWNIGWVILPSLSMTWAAGHTSMALPPGCLCTMFQCCDAEARKMYNCKLFDAHVRLMALDANDSIPEELTDEVVANEDLQRVCQAYMDGTMDANTTVCDAIINDESFQEAFSYREDSPTATRFSLFLEAATDQSCNDLILDTCPPATDYVFSTVWARLEIVGCAGIGTLVQEVPFAYQFGCDKKEEEGQLEIYQGRGSILDMETCSAEPNHFFNDDTANGEEGKLWMCQENSILLGDGNFTIARGVYTNLGALACYLPPLTSEPTPSPNSGAVDTPGFVITALSSFVLGILTYGTSLY